MLLKRQRTAKKSLIDYQTLETTMDTMSLEGRPYIELHRLLKLEGWCETGGVAKQAIAAAMVSVNDRVELRKGCKIRAGSIVTYSGRSVQVTE
jgi:ribosome-associated protein